METLLSVAFDNLSSYDGPKVKKGLRQVEGLLAQICLSAHAANRNKNNNNNNPRSPSSRATSPSDGPKQPAQPPAKARFPLSDLSGDAAFREFFKLQDGFQWNIATRLIQTLDRLLAKSDDGSMDLLMLSALDSLQGTLLLHPPSRLLFSREQSMNVGSLSAFPTAAGHFLSFKQHVLTRSTPAPPRPPRARQLPGHPGRHPPGPGRRPPRDPAQHPHL